MLVAVDPARGCAIDVVYLMKAQVRNLSVERQVGAMKGTLRAVKLMIEKERKTTEEKKRVFVPELSDDEEPEETSKCQKRLDENFSAALHPASGNGVLVFGAPK